MIWQFDFIVISKAINNNPENYYALKVTDSAIC